MNVHSRQWVGAVALGTALLMAAGTGACAVNDHGSVSVLAIWTGDEQRAFTTILDRFTARTGIKVNYTGTRAVSQVLATDVKTGTPPDVAVLSSAGELAGYARRQALHPLDQAGMQVTPPRGSLWQHVEALGGSVRYAVTVKATLKSMIWYRRDHRFEVPQRWDDLVRTGTAAPGAGVAWCLGLEATPTSGWPGTDWIEDILLHTDAEAYQQLSAGKLRWTDSRVQAAWRAWDQVLQTIAPPGSPRDPMLTASFDDADRTLVTGAPAACWLDHEASFVAGTAAASASTAHHDVDFFPFPDASMPGAPDGHRSWEVSVDLASMFRDTPQARQLITFLASDEAQRMWPTVSSTAFSTRPNVTYTSEVGRRIAGILTGGATLCIDPSDLMPPATDAFYGAVLAYAHRPDRLTTLLDQLDQVRASVRDQIVDVPCG
jgi:alpha-glucoside transport system substrate-binding protein